MCQKVRIYSIPDLVSCMQSLQANITAKGLQNAKQALMDSFRTLVTKLRISGPASISILAYNHGNNASSADISKILSLRPDASISFTVVGQANAITDNPSTTNSAGTLFITIYVS